MNYDINDLREPGDKPRDAIADVPRASDDLANTESSRGGSSHGNCSTVQMEIEHFKKLTDPNSAAPDEELMGPPELRRCDESLPGAFHAGGNVEITGTQRPHELLDSVDQARFRADVLVSAELVSEPPIEFVRAEPIGMNSEVAFESDHCSEIKESRLKWIRSFPVVVVLAGLLSIFVGLSISIMARKGPNESALIHYANSPPYRENKYGNVSSSIELVSLHAVVWGFRTDCDEFDASPLEISCPGEVEILLTDYTDCSVPDVNSAICEWKNRTGMVLFRCVRDTPDIALDATVRLPKVEAKNCRNQENPSYRRLRRLSSPKGSETVTFAGTAENYMALGRFCYDPELHLRNAYTCESAGNRRRKLGDSTSIYCQSSGVCTNNVACISPDDVSCTGDCSIQLDSLEISDDDAECVFNAGRGDGAIGEGELRQYQNLVYDQMFLQWPSHT